MKTPVAAISLLLSLCALRASGQVTPYRQGVTVLRNSCPSAADLAGRAVEPATAAVLSNIAAGIANGTGRFRGLARRRHSTLHARWYARRLYRNTSRGFLVVIFV